MHEQDIRPDVRRNRQVVAMAAEPPQCPLGGRLSAFCHDMWASRVRCYRSSAQALWLALESELGKLASEHAGEVQRLYDRCEAALRAADAAATAQRERSPADGCGVQHNPLFDHVADRQSEAGSVAGRSSMDGDDNETRGDAAGHSGADANAARLHAAEMASVRAACEARLAAAQEEIDIKSARLAELEVCKQKAFTSFWA